MPIRVLPTIRRRGTTTEQTLLRESAMAVLEKNVLESVVRIVMLM